MLNESKTVKEPIQVSTKAKVDTKGLNLAASWYVAMWSPHLGKKPLEIELFGKPLVAWRDSKGYPVIMERYCSHQGASLAMGEVVEDCIQCPYHFWLYDKTGQCVSIPDVKANYIPPAARQAIYFTVERYGYIWVWYGSQTPLFPLPEFPAAESEKHNYMPLRFTNDAKTTVRRMVENQYDFTHLPTLHKLKITAPVQFTSLDDNPEQQGELPIKKEAWFGVLAEIPIGKYFGFMGAVAQLLGLNAKSFTMRVDSWPSGNIFTIFVNGKERWRALKSTTPISENRTIEQNLVMVKKNENFLLNIPTYLIFGLQNKAVSEQDIPIWNAMDSDKGGVYVKSDARMLKFREFYQRWVNQVEFK